MVVIKLKIVALIGSVRADSYNLNLVRTMKERYENKITLEIADIGTLPHFNQDQEHNPPEVVTAFKKQIAGADGILISTAEYNWSIPGVLKNTLDWLSRVDRVLVNKPVMIIGASPGMLGTIRAQLHLRQVLASPGLSARVLPPAGNEVVINFADQKIDQSGRFNHQQTLTFLDGVVERFIDSIKFQPE